MQKDDTPELEVGESSVGVPKCANDAVSLRSAWLACLSLSLTKLRNKTRGSG